jgi:dihydrofolate reductase
MATKKNAARTRGTPANSRKLVAQAFVSMDGVMQAPGGPDEDRDSGFPHGGWSMAYWDDDMGRIMSEYTSQPCEVLLGRKTYDIFAAYWPEHRDQTGASLNELTKHVASRTKKKLDWENSELLHGDVVAAVKALKRQPGLPLNVVGSANLLQTLLKNDLVDELETWVFPVVLGTGKRLFDDGAIPTAWKLTRNQATSTGVLIQHYERAGDIVYGQPPGT